MRFGFIYSHLRSSCSGLPTVIGVHILQISLFLSVIIVKECHVIFAVWLGYFHPWIEITIDFMPRMGEKGEGDKYQVLVICFS